MKTLPWILFVVTALGLALLASQTRTQSTEIQHLLADNADLKTRYDDATNRVAELSAFRQLKPLPLKVTTRPALMGSGKVVVFQNDGGDSLRISITLHNAGNESKQYEDVLDPNQMKEIGHLQGWSFIAGDEVAVTSPGYRPQKWTIN